MKYLRTIVVACLALTLSAAVAYAAQEVETVHGAAQPRADKVILVNNPYPDQVTITYLCVYYYKDPWKGVCEKINKKHPGFYLRNGEQLSAIQRIGLLGKNLVVNGNAMAECLVHFDHDESAMKRLQDSKNYIAQVNYVSGSDMVCSLLTESN